MAKVLAYQNLVTLFVLLNLTFLINARPLNIMNDFSLGSILDAGPSPGIGHGVEDKATLGGIKAGPSPGIGHGYALGGIKVSPSHATGHEFMGIQTLGGIKDGPSPGIGHRFVTAPTLGELKKSGPSPGAGH
ncbi:hypothetical protein CTI12_AA114350 [Artemisia annua]|uniref:Uncharacterized protein n=1 Tax=Artemisia annua TaxID=35608 RepID=A0A2U1PTJ4_ARTAN|nr:hypothetical protein CTI12_AA114350 [Artemisia annua]